jgi:hypothetical protein
MRTTIDFKTAVERGKVLAAQIERNAWELGELERVAKLRRPRLKAV